MVKRKSMGETETKALVGIGDAKLCETPCKCPCKQGRAAW